MISVSLVSFLQFGFKYLRSGLCRMQLVFIRLLFFLLTCLCLIWLKHFYVFCRIVEDMNLFGISEIFEIVLVLPVWFHLLFSAICLVYFLRSGYKYLRSVRWQMQLVFSPHILFLLSVYWLTIPVWFHRSVFLIESQETLVLFLKKISTAFFCSDSCLICSKRFSIFLDCREIGVLFVGGFWNLRKRVICFWVPCVRFYFCVLVSSIWDPYSDKM